MHSLQISMCIRACVDSLTSLPPLTQDYIWGEAVQMLSEVGQVVVNVWPLENLLHLFFKFTANVNT